MLGTSGYNAQGIQAQPANLMQQQNQMQSLNQIAGLLGQLGTNPIQNLFALLAGAPMQMPLTQG